jgi:hypothetical protein
MAAASDAVLLSGALSKKCPSGRRRVRARAWGRAQGTGAGARVCVCACLRVFVR